MKKIKLILPILLMMAIFGCSKNTVDKPAAVATKFSEPNWKADDSGKYPATMTAVISLPAELATGAMENDKLAAFVDNECRGVGVMVNVNNHNLFYVLIQGLSEESNSITIRYYSNKTSYMYESKAAFNFLIDAVYGTTENSKTLTFMQLK